MYSAQGLGVCIVQHAGVEQNVLALDTNFI